MNISSSSQTPPQWSADLFSAEDIGLCCITCFLPCITFGRIAEMVSEGKNSCVQQGCIYGLLMMCSVQCLLSCFYREKLRSQFGLPAEPCNDCCVHFFCEPCALCQEHAELKNRGLDPSRGWNHESHTTAPPMVPPTMTR